MRNKKALTTSIILIIICLVCIFNALAHSGRTDANGGHWDNSTGTYHYHSKSNANQKPKSNMEAVFEAARREIPTTLKKGDGEGYSDEYGVEYDYGYEDGYKARIEEASAEREKEMKFLMLLVLITIVVVWVVKLIKRHRKGK